MQLMLQASKGVEETADSLANRFAPPQQLDNGKLHTIADTETVRHREVQNMRMVVYSMQNTVNHMKTTLVSKADKWDVKLLAVWDPLQSSWYLPYSLSLLIFGCIVRYFRTIGWKSCSLGTV